ncbi:MAG: hypothetical protein KF832_12615 [Caldilineaceae bacterium]|nr:hypothetical protein [Caldilineaceae bacterium]
MVPLVGIGAFSTWSAWWNYITVTLQRQAAKQASWATQYNVLRAYYLANGVYDVLPALLRGLGTKAETLESLRNPAYRVVEFYAAKTFPGALPQALPIVTEHSRLVDALHQLWLWSNWASEKQAVARSFPLYGDLFLKAATRTNAQGRLSRVYLQNLEPQTVTDFDVDERGYLTFVRIDVPQTRRKADGKQEAYIHTEVWDKAAQRFQRWAHQQSPSQSLAQLGPPTEEHAFGEFGIDFVPIVWQPFRHIGDERGMAAITPALDKIDEANRQATRLHQMLFRYNKPLWAATAGGVDSAGRPLPPPRLGGSDGSILELSEDPTVDDVVRLPGATALAALVPALNYESALNVLRDQMAEIRRDLPEMIYSEIQERSDLSGVAIRYLMEAAIDRLLEARGNAESALIRAQQMALTIGQNAGLFSNLGSYEAGDFDHSFAPRPVLSAPELERAQMVQTYVSAGVPLATATRRAGWSDTEREQLEEERQEEQANQQAGLGAALLNAQANFDREE